MIFAIATGNFAGEKFFCFFRFDHCKPADCVVLYIPGEVGGSSADCDAGAAKPFRGTRKTVHRQLYILH